MRISKTPRLILAPMSFKERNVRANTDSGKNVQNQLFFRFFILLNFLEKLPALSREHQALYRYR